MGFIDQFGWALMGVFDPDNEEPSFTYSTGILETLGEPEVIVFGLESDTRKWLCNEYGNRLRDGNRFEPNRDIENLVKGYPVRLIDVDTTRPEVFADHLCWTHWYYGRRDFPIRQLVWPDKEGRFPWEPDCSEATRRQQPLLGTLPI
ncbi:MAG: DUF4262 domain-containing protein [Alphaproteobacteria bacterium]|nr:DUF4262 domain-containing protein [Alphaproteobacteria bacterium]